MATSEMLERKGFSAAIRSGFFAPFLGGTFFDAQMSTSSRITELVFRSFFVGDVAIPAFGMQQLPDQLAARLPAGVVRTGAAVTEVGDGEVTLRDGEVLRAGHVVVAVDGPEAAGLLGDRLPDQVAPGRGTATVYYRADVSPIDGPDLVLDADGSGPAHVVTALSEVAPSYAPAGRGALLSVSTVGVPEVDDATLDDQLRTQLTGWYGGEVAGWDRLATYRIPYAQPRQDVGDLPSLAREVRIGPRTWVCGDHRDTASIQGALVSGRRTADAIVQERHDRP